MDLQLLLILSSYISFVAGVRVRDVQVPLYMVVGESTSFRCHFDMEGEILYSLKWWKDEHQFFQYIPRNHPEMVVFKVPGVEVDILQSSLHQVSLRNVSIITDGQFRCEVVAEAPTFNTHSLSANTTVIDAPDGPPVVTGLRDLYYEGETIVINCTSYNANPPPALNWEILEPPKQEHPHHQENHLSLVPTIKPSKSNSKNTFQTPRFAYDDESPRKEGIEKDNNINNGPSTTLKSKLYLKMDEKKVEKDIDIQPIETSNSDLLLTSLKKTSSPNYTSKSFQLSSLTSSVLPFPISSAINTIKKIFSTMSPIEIISSEEIHWDVADKNINNNNNNNGKLQNMNRDNSDMNINGRNTLLSKLTYSSEIIIERDDDIDEITYENKTDSNIQPTNDTTNSILGETFNIDLNTTNEDNTNISSDMNLSNSISSISDAIRSEEFVKKVNDDSAVNKSLNDLSHSKIFINSSDNFDDNLMSSSINVAEIESRDLINLLNITSDLNTEFRLFLQDDNTVNNLDPSASNNSLDVEDYITTQKYAYTELDQINLNASIEPINLMPHKETTMPPPVEYSQTFGYSLTSPSFSTRNLVKPSPSRESTTKLADRVIFKLLVNKNFEVFTSSPIPSEYPATHLTQNYSTVVTDGPTDIRHPLYNQERDKRSLYDDERSTGKYSEASIDDAYRNFQMPHFIQVPEKSVVRYPPERDVNNSSSLYTSTLGLILRVGENIAPHGVLSLRCKADVYIYEWSTEVQTQISNLRMSEPQQLPAMQSRPLPPKSAPLVMKNSAYIKDHPQYIFIGLLFILFLIT